MDTFEQKNKHHKTSKKSLKKIVLTGVGVFALLYASNGFAVRDTINTGVRKTIQHGTDVVTTDIGEATESLYKTIEKAYEKNEDISSFYQSMQEATYTLYEHLPPEHKIETLDTLLQQSQPELQQLFAQKLYTLQDNEFKRQFIEGNLSDLSPEERTKLRQEMTADYLATKKEEFNTILRNARERLQPLYDSVQSIFMLYN